MTTQSATLPRWDVTGIYPSLDSPEFQADFAALGVAVDAFGTELDRRQGAPSEGGVSREETAEALDALITQLNALLEQATTIHAYIGAFVSVDSRNDLAQAKLSLMHNLLARLKQAYTRFTAWVGTLDGDTLIASSTIAEAHAFFIAQAQVHSRHLMSPAEEELAAALAPSSSAAWENLHSSLTSQLLVRVAGEQHREELPLSVVRNRATDPDRAVRKLAYEGELRALSAVAPAAAAALNGLKGRELVLAERRGWGSPLDAALFTAHIDRRTLDALMEAAHASLPDFRRYLRTKARALGVPALAWYDLQAPVGESTRTWDYAAGAEFIVEQFATFSPRLSGLARRAFAESWIDAEPREGKQGGAFCMALRGEESRILANFNPSFDGISTLAHELGHAYHNFCLAERTPLQRDTPMTLAETASIFCETIIYHAGLKRADAGERLLLLEGTLQSQCQVVVDIISRFLFEQDVFEKRRERDLSVDELNQLMLAAQGQTYGDALDRSTYHPSMWVVKGHYYIAEFAFYNFPYLFGLLFGLGLYARYQADPERFQERYDRLLSSTGLASTATLASQFGIDIQDTAFWADSLAVIGADIDQFAAVIDARKPA
jgi:pepF/M3 family oligoendopeptidase